MKQQDRTWIWSRPFSSNWVRMSAGSHPRTPHCDWECKFALATTYVGPRFFEWIHTNACHPRWVENITNFLLRYNPLAAYSPPSTPQWRCEVFTWVLEFRPPSRRIKPKYIAAVRQDLCHRAVNPPSLSYSCFVHFENRSSSYTTS